MKKSLFFVFLSISLLSSCSPSWESGLSAPVSSDPISSDSVSSEEEKPIISSEAISSGSSSSSFYDDGKIFTLTLKPIVITHVETESGGHWTYYCDWTQVPILTKYLHRGETFVSDTLQMWVDVYGKPRGDFYGADEHDHFYMTRTLDEIEELDTIGPLDQDTLAYYFLVRRVPQSEW